MSVNSLELIHKLLDEGSFVELGAKATSISNIGDASKYNDGVIIGYGTIAMKPVFVYAQDESVLSASIGKMHAKKIAYILNMAKKMGNPVIGFLSNSGIRINEEDNAFFALGNVLKAQSKIKGYVPQIAIVTGNCGGGTCILAQNSDFIFMEEKEAKLFTIAPNSIPKNIDEKICEGATLSANGIVDAYGSIDEMIQKTQELISLLPSNAQDNDSYVECSDDLNRLTPGVSNMKANEIIKEIADNKKIFKLKEKSLPSTQIGFARFNGQTVGFVVNNSDKPTVGYSTMIKAAKFIDFLNEFRIPLLTIADANGFNPLCNRLNEMGVSAGTLINSYIKATIPKVTLVKNAISYAGFVMGSKSLGIDIVYAFENAHIGALDEKRAVELLYAKEISASNDKLKFIEEKTNEYITNNTSALHAASLGVVDDVIDDSKTRQLVVSSFEMLFTKQ